MSSFKAPIGTDEERASGIIWPSTWTDATPYLTKYSLGYHTGADLNNNYSGHWDADAHAPVYAIGDGKVTYAQLFPNPKYWGKLVIIDHGIVDGKPLFTRSAHVEALNVSVGQSVKTGDPIARVGNGEGLFAYHLHFDISTTEKLREMPHYWPGQDRKGVEEHFVDPKKWLREPMHVVQGQGKVDPVVVPPVVTPDPNKPTVWYVIAPSAQIRSGPSKADKQIGLLVRGTKLSLEKGGVNKDSYTWGLISEGQHKGSWVAIGKEDRTETYVSTNPPR